jgi:hypothetical protein
MQQGGSVDHINIDNLIGGYQGISRSRVDMVLCARDLLSRNVWICDRTREVKLAALNGSTLAN